MVFFVIRHHLGLHELDQELIDLLLSFTTLDESP